MKLGRNDACPCRSGKKVKRCCGRDSLPGIVPTSESAQSFLRPQLKKLGPKIRAAMRAEIQKALWEVREAASWREAAYDSERMENQIIFVRDRFRAIVGASHHDRQYWFVVVRALAHDFFDIIYTLTEKTPTHAYLPEFLHSLTELVFWCDSPSTPVDWVADGSVKGIAIGISEQLLVTAGQLAGLTFVHSNAEAGYRYTGKGFTMRALEGDLSPQEHDIESSVRSFEERKQRFLTILGDAGFWYDAGATFPLRPEIAYLWGVSEAKPGRVLLTHSTQPRVTVSGPYLVMPLTEPRYVTGVDFARHRSLSTGDPWGRGNCLAMLPYDTLLDRFAEIIQISLGLTAAHLTSFLYALGTFVASCTGFSLLDTSEEDRYFVWPAQTSTSWRQQLLSHYRDATELAILRSSREQWILALSGTITSIVTQHPEVARLSTNELAAIIDRFTFRGPATRRRKDEPYLFWALSDETLLFDFFATESFIHDLFAATQTAEKHPRRGKQARRGAFFEAQVASFLTRELGLDARKVVIGFYAGRCEIDLAFVLNRVLFVVDCKARLKDAADIAGDFKKVRARLEVFEHELAKKIPKRIDAIRAGRVANTIARGDFDDTRGLVCTSTVEYLPKAELRFWAGSLPLVGPPEELLATIWQLARSTGV